MTEHSNCGNFPLRLENYSYSSEKMLRILCPKCKEMLTSALKNKDITKLSEKNVDSDLINLIVYEIIQQHMEQNKENHIRQKIYCPRCDSISYFVGERIQAAKRCDVCGFMAFPISENDIIC